VVTRSVADLPEIQQTVLGNATSQRSARTTTVMASMNFGSFRPRYEKYFWKIDYYDADACTAPMNPADPL